jgi:hypothetical protein
MEQEHLLPDMTIDSIAAQHFRDIAKWANFLSIISFIGCGLIIAVGIYLAITLAQLSNINRELGSSYGASYAIGMAIGYSFFAAIWLFLRCYFFNLQ